MNQRMNQPSLAQAAQALPYGVLYLIPVPLGAMGASSLEAVLPAPVVAQTRRLQHFVVEHAKTARAFLKSVGTDTPLQALELHELNEHSKSGDIAPLLAPLLAGNDVGLLSEAGCPAVADPGAELVAAAQARGIRVVPFVGPSSLLLALMGSGLCGQRFAFHGYLPAKEDERAKTIKALELESQKQQQTQLFIETPYRNQAMLASLLQHCRPETRLCLACDLTLPSELIQTKTCQEWQQAPLPDLDKRPTVFLFLAANASSQPRQDSKPATPAPRSGRKPKSAKFKTK